MKYREIELVEYKPTEPVIFNPPKKMLVWDDRSIECFETDVVAVIPTRECFPVVGTGNSYSHCADIPEVVTLATYRELASWLAHANGELRFEEHSHTCYCYLSYLDDSGSKPVPPKYLVRKWGDTDWHTPSRAYLGLEG